MNQTNEDLSPYFTLRLPLLGLMAIVAVLGIVLSCVCHAGLL